MLQATTLKFLENLSKNNNKPWFDEHRDEYDDARKDFEQHVSELLGQMTAIEPALGEQKAKDCVFRIFRDVRFSKDKTPYKAHFGAYLSRGGRKFPGAGYYLHLEPGKSFAGGGLWMPEPSLLKSVRQEIDYNFDEFTEIIEARSFKKLFKQLEGETLKTLPQGYAADNPAIDYLKMKSFTVGHALTDKEVLHKSFTSECVNVFAGIKDLVDFLNRALD